MTTLTCDRMRVRGNWDLSRGGHLRFDPEWTDRFMHTMIAGAPNRLEELAMHEATKSTCVVLVLRGRVNGSGIDPAVGTPDARREFGHLKERKPSPNLYPLMQRLA